MRINLPEKETVYKFIFGIITVLITAFVGYFFIESQTTRINQNWIEQREWVQERNKFIENFTVLGQRRIYLSENYYINKTTYESPEVLNESWKNYLNSIIAWNEKNLLNPIFIEYYFGKEAKNRFNEQLLPKMVNLHASILRLRNGENVSNMENIIEEAKNELFLFSEEMMFSLSDQRPK